MSKVFVIADYFRQNNLNLKIDHRNFAKNEDLKLSPKDIKEFNTWLSYDMGLKARLRLSNITNKLSYIVYG